MVRIRVRAAGKGIIYCQQLEAVISLGPSAQLCREEHLDLPYHRHQVSFHLHCYPACHLETQDHSLRQRVTEVKGQNKVICSPSYLELYCLAGFL